MQYDRIKENPIIVKVLSYAFKIVLEIILLKNKKKKNVRNLTH